MKPRGKKKKEGEEGNEKHRKHAPAAGSQSWWCCRAGIQWGSQWCWDPTEHPVVLGFKGVPRAAGIPWGMQQCGDLMGTQCCGDCMGTQQCWDPMGHPVVLHRAPRAVGIQWGTQLPRRAQVGRAEKGTAQLCDFWWKENNSFRRT